MATDPWEAALDRFEAYLGQEEDALERGGAHAAAPPTPRLGPIPQHLAPRAQALLARSLDLEDRIGAAAAAVRRRLVEVRSAEPDTPPLFVDRRG